MIPRITPIALPRRADGTYRSVISSTGVVTVIDKVSAKPSPALLRAKREWLDEASSRPMALQERREADAELVPDGSWHYVCRHLLRDSELYHKLLFMCTPAGVDQINEETWEFLEVYCRPDEETCIPDDSQYFRSLNAWLKAAVKYRNYNMELGQVLRTAREKLHSLRSTESLQVEHLRTCGTSLAEMQRRRKELIANKSKLGNSRVYTLSVQTENRPQAQSAAGLHIS